MVGRGREPLPLYVGDGMSQSAGPVGTQAFSEVLCPKVSDAIGSQRQPLEPAGLGQQEKGKRLCSSVTNMVAAQLRGWGGGGVGEGAGEGRSQNIEDMQAPVWSC